MTIEDYEQLPELLPTNKFLEVTGLTAYTLRQLLEVEVLSCLQAGRRKKRLFHKRNLLLLDLLDDDER